MKRLIAYLLFAAALYGQATMTSTTTSQAIGRNDSVIYLASLTGINTATPTQSASILVIDQEAMRVTTTGSNFVTVARGLYGTGQNAHASAVTVWAGAPELFAYTDPSGACVATSLRITPRVVIPSGAIWDCTGGVWVQRGSGGGGSGNGDPAAYSTVTYSSTPTFAVAKNTGHAFQLTLTGDATASVDASGISSSGRPVVTMRICQDGGGSHAFTWPAAFLNHGTVDGTASTCTTQTFVFDGTNFQALGVPIVTGTSDAISIPGSTSGAVKIIAPATAGTGSATVIGGTNTVAGMADPSDTQVVNWIGTDGVIHRIAQSGGGAQILTTGTDGNRIATGTSYIAPFSAFNIGVSAFEAIGQLKVRRAGTLSKLCIGIGSSTQGVGGALTVTMHVNAGATTLLATVPAGTAAPFWACDDTHTASVADGDLLGFVVVNADSGDSAYVAGISVLLQ